MFDFRQFDYIGAWGLNRVTNLIQALQRRSAHVVLVLNGWMKSEIAWQHLLMIADTRLTVAEAVILIVEQRRRAA